MDRSFPAQYAATKNALDWAVGAASPFPADLAEKLRAMNPARYDEACRHLTYITKAIPYLEALRDEMAARACHRCFGTGEYAGPSAYTRRGRKYCFTCDGLGTTAKSRAAATNA